MTHPGAPNRVLARSVLGLVLATGLLAATAGTAVGAPPAVYSRGSLTIEFATLFDVDRGRLHDDINKADFYFGDLGDGDFSSLYTWNAKAEKMGGTKPGYAGCKNADVASGRAYRASRLASGTWLCAHTNKGRVARIKVVASSETELRIAYTTWADE